MHLSQRRGRGFTLIELMIVIAIIAIIATMAMPSYQDRVIRVQVSEGMKLSEFAQGAIEEYYRKTHSLPPDNAAAGLPPPELIVGNYVSSLTVRGGVISITYGSRSNRFLSGKVLSLRPATVAGFAKVPIAWVCGRASIPAKMTAPDANLTDVPDTHLPLDCRVNPTT